jgi:hypothetical protein
MSNIKKSNTSLTSVNQLQPSTSLKRFIKKAGGEIVCNGDWDKHFKVFNNKGHFFYSEKGKVLTEKQFHIGLRLMKQNITYFTMDWRKWVNANRVMKGGNWHDVKHNAIIYFALLTDKGEMIPCAYIAEMDDVTDKNEAETLIEAGCLDSAIDLFCQSICDNWEIMSIVPIPAGKFLPSEAGKSENKKVK